MSTQGTLPFQESQKARVKFASDRTSPSQNPVTSVGRARPSWLGLVTSHRRLFDAGQDGWMRPLAHSSFVLGNERFVSEDFSTGRNVVPVRLAFDVDKLPFPDVLKDLERGATGNDDGDVAEVVQWRAPIPLYAVKRVEVPSIEQKARLVAMASQTSNVSLPCAEIFVRNFGARSSVVGGSATSETQSLELPETLNAIHGAMAMAVWAVPHIEPWIEVLQHALDRDAAGAAERTMRLDANWLQLPWLVGDLSRSGRDDVDDQKSLWRAALHCMRCSNVADKSPAALAERIAEEARLAGNNQTAKSWLDRTRSIVAGEATITCDGWRQNGAGLAIRLALLRPDPIKFSSWNRDVPGVPPAVWWAAATLCGWRHGYRALDKKFRGDAALQEFVATRALEASWPDGDSAALPRSQQTSLKRTGENERFVLTWRGHTVVSKPWQSRAKWYNADLSDVAASSAALDVAGRLGWPCIERWVTLPKGRVETRGNGSLVVDGDALVVKGEKCLRLPEGANVEERLDPDAFGRQLATEAGVVTDPPEVARHQTVSDPSGFIYKPEFITEAEETKLLDLIDRAEWSTELRRRVQHYGWRYDYTKRRLDESMRAGALPTWAQELARKLVDEGLMKDLPDQVIVNEYLGKQGIAQHIDEPNSFTGQVATISLLETWGMVFRRRDTKKKIEKQLERRSVAVFTGDARYKWTHEIPKRTNEPLLDRDGKRRWVARTRRISLTFRRTRLRRGA